MQVIPGRQRPEGVTILGVLSILGGIAGVVAGGALMLAALVVGTITSPLKDFLTSQGYPQLVSYVTTSNVATILGILGVFSLLVGIFWVAVGFGALRGRGWAWTVGIIVLVLSIINSIIQVAFGNIASVAGLAIDLGIIYYLTRPKVRAFFGKTLAPAWQPKSAP